MSMVRFFQIPCYPIFPMWLMAGFLVFLVACPAAAAYDPLAVPEEFSPGFTDFDIQDVKRDRVIPVRIWLPRTGAVTMAEAAKSPVLLFSHGLGGNREGSQYLGKHWSARGYAVVFVQHPGSDDSVWRGEASGSRRKSLEGAASGKNFFLRVRDIPAVLDQLEKWDSTPGHALCGRLDLTRVGMSGHSFGAVTAQAVSGQGFGEGKIAGLIANLAVWRRNRSGRGAGVGGIGGLGITDPRISAAVIMSPSAPRRGEAATAFGGVSIPWLLMTGTHDIAPIGGADMESRLSVYPALPSGGKYEVVFDGAEHSAFTERILPGDQLGRNPNHHRAILALTTAFWDAWVRRDLKAREWLDGAGPLEILQKADRWRRK